jgi:hypothetical protein
MMQACGAVMRHASVTTATTAAVDACILTERASAQAISANRSWLATTGFQMKTCAFTVQSDKVEAALPALQENWAEVKRSILQSETAVISAVALQIQGAQRVMTESVGASLTVTTSQNTHTHVLLGQILQALQPGFTATNATASGQMHYQGNEKLQMMPAASFQSPDMIPAASFLRPGASFSPATFGDEGGHVHYEGNETLQMMPAASFQSLDMLPAASFLRLGASFSPEPFGDEGGHCDDFIMLMTDQEEAAYSTLSSVDNLCGEPVFHTAVPHNHLHLLQKNGTDTCSLPDCAMDANCFANQEWDPDVGPPFTLERAQQSTSTTLMPPATPIQPPTSVPSTSRTLQNDARSPNPSWVRVSGIPRTEQTDDRRLSTMRTPTANAPAEARKPLSAMSAGQLPALRMRTVGTSGRALDKSSIENENQLCNAHSSLFSKLLSPDRMRDVLTEQTARGNNSSSSAFYWHSKQISGPPLCPIS